MIVAQGSRLQREKQQLKIPQEAGFASEEAEALPAESDCPERKSAEAVIVFLSFILIRLYYNKSLNNLRWLVKSQEVQREKQQPQEVGFFRRS
ncbi:hypothetical protein [Oceanobacillus massiliensis]|uniref:hypothetical protein n=1 Tax=Oceanobacillus massiliensis TaxID=1465765 RepID=UPI0002898AE2|nr:hypothetical protein [Oceanobacillus massiliensis]